MAHLTGFGLKNFRVFKDETWFDFAPITILTGTNSCGKSTINKSLLLLKENFLKKGKMSLSSIEELQFDNELKLGGFTKITNIQDDDIIYSFPHKLPYFVDDDYILKFYYSKNLNNQIDEAYLRKVELYTNSGSKVIDIEFVNEKKITSRLDLSYFKKKIDDLALYYFDREALNSNSILNVAEKDGDCNSNVCKTPIDKLEDIYFQILEESGNRNRIELDNIFKYDLLAIDKSNIRGLGPYARNFGANPDKLSCFKYKNESHNDLYRHNSRLFEYPLFFDSIENLDLIVKSKKYTKGAGNEISLDDEKVDWVRDIINFKLQYGFYFEDSVRLEDLIKQLELKILGGYVSECPIYFFNDQTPVFFDAICKVNNHSFDINIDSLTSPLEVFLWGHYLSKSRSSRNFYPVLNRQDSNFNIFKNIVLDNFKKSKFFISIPIGIDYLSVERAKNDRLFNFDDNKSSSLNSILLEYFRRDLNKYDFMVNFINKWINEFDIADSIEIIPENEGLGAYVYLVKNGTKIALSDMGFGVAQILPILLKIITNAEKKFNSPVNTYISSSIMIIEEPEINLHPALQSKLADMFVDATRTFNIQFIIETHSEYFIRRMQYLTAKKEIKPEDSIIHYFFNPDSVHTKKTGEQLRTIRIQQDGRLDKEFGTGFFDESTKLMMSILSGESLN